MDEILETILKLYGKPGIDASYLPKLIRNKVTGEVRRGYGEPDSSLEEVCWEFNGKNGDATQEFPSHDERYDNHRRFSYSGGPKGERFLAKIERAWKAPSAKTKMSLLSRRR